MSKDESDSDNDKTQKIAPPASVDGRSGYGRKTIAAIVAAVLALTMVGFGGVAVSGLLYSSNSWSIFGKVTVEEATIVERVAKPILGEDMRIDCDDAEPTTLCRVNYMKRHQEAVVDYVGLDGDREQFRVYATLNEQGNLVGLKGECEGVVITDVIMDNLLSGGTYCEVTVVCQEHMSDDCKDDRPAPKKATADSKENARTKNTTEKGDAMTIAKSASNAAERAQKTADEALAVANDNKGMLAQILSHFGLTADGEDVDKSEEEDKPS